MGWYPISTAPHDGSTVRVRVNGAQKGERYHRYEPPYEMRWDAGRWRYSRTNAPVFPWHEPLEWTFDPRTLPEQRDFERRAKLAYGSQYLPSLKYNFEESA